jgi:hypothetical protein
MRLRREAEASRENSAVTPATATSVDQAQSNAPQSAEERIEALKSTDTNLGDVDGLSSATAAVGAIIDALIPRDGNKAALSIKFDIPVHPLVKINFALSGSAMRIGDQAMLSASVSLGVKIEGKIKAFWVELKTYLGVSGTGYLKALGDTAEEAFAFMGLGAREIVAQYSEKAASFMMSSQDRENVIGLMSDKEYAELGLGISVSAGASFSNDIDKDNSNVTGVGVSAGYQQGIRFSDEDNDGNLEKTNTAQVNAKINAALNLERLGLKNTSGGAAVSVTISYTNGEISAVGVSFGVDGSVEATNFDMMFLAECFTGMTTEMLRIIGSGGDYFSGKGARLLGQIAHTANSLAIGDNIAGRLVNMSNIPVGVKSKPNFQVSLKWKPGGDCSLGLKLTNTVSADVDAGIASISASLGDTLVNLNLPFKV